MTSSDARNFVAWAQPSWRWRTVGLAAGVLNCAFVVESLLPGATPASSTVVSDLAADGRPGHLLFRAADGLSALLLLAMAAALWRAARPAGQRPPVTAWWLSTVGVATFALSTFGAALVSKRCSGCTPSDAPDWQDRVHDVISTLGTTGGVLAALGLAIATRRRRPVSAAHLSSFLLAGGLGVLFSVAEVTGGLGWIGWPQRAQIVVLSAWFVVIGWTLDLRPGPPDDDPSLTV